MHFGGADDLSLRALVRPATMCRVLHETTSSGWPEGAPTLRQRSTSRRSSPARTGCSQPFSLAQSRALRNPYPDVAMGGMTVWSGTWSGRASTSSGKLSRTSFGSIDEAQWSTPSLCAGLTVREVLAHLTVSGAVSGPRWFAGVVRARFDFDKQVDDRLREQLGASSSETLSRFRSTIGSRTSPPLPRLVAARRDGRSRRGHPSAAWSGPRLSGRGPRRIAALLRGYRSGGHRQETGSWPAAGGCGHGHQPRGRRRRPR